MERQDRPILFRCRCGKELDRLRWDWTAGRLQPSKRYVVVEGDWPLVGGLPQLVRYKCRACRTRVVVRYEGWPAGVEGAVERALSEERDSIKVGVDVEGHYDGQEWAARLRSSSLKAPIPGTYHRAHLDRFDSDWLPEV